MRIIVYSADSARSIINQNEIIDFCRGASIARSDLRDLASAESLRSAGDINARAAPIGMHREEAAREKSSRIIPRAMRTGPADRGVDRAAIATPRCRSSRVIRAHRNNLGGKNDRRDGARRKSPVDPIAESAAASSVSDKVRTRRGILRHRRPGNFRAVVIYGARLPGLAGGRREGTGVAARET